MSAGVRFLDVDRFVSTSVDQRITLWRRIDANHKDEFPWQWTTCYFSNIADIADFEAWKSRCDSFFTLLNLFPTFFVSFLQG